MQGTIGGIGFLVVGLEAPILWGAIMAVCALIPAVGTALVWAPAAIYLVAVGAWVKALILVGIGLGVIGTIDNALRPILVGRDAGMPDYMILLSTLAGLATFGISGLVIGPVIAGLFLTVWSMFTEEFGPADDEMVAEPEAVVPIARGAGSRRRRAARGGPSGARCASGDTRDARG